MAQEQASTAWRRAALDEIDSGTKVREITKVSSEKQKEPKKTTIGERIRQVLLILGALVILYLFAMMIINGVR